MTHQVSVAVSRRAVCGEGPVWDAATGFVHWVDILAREILTTDPASGATTVVTYPEMVGAAVPRSDGGFVAAVVSGFVGLGTSGEITHRADCLTEGIRMNDAKTDPNGVFWSGSCAMDFAAGQGGLWRLDGMWQPELVVDGLTQPNGMGWSPGGDEFYLAETQDKVVLRFGFDPATSRLDRKPTVLIGPDSFTGLPDGLCVDTRGHLWIAEFGGSVVREFTAEGDLVGSIAIPTLQTTSCAFVGPELDELWVTSAALNLDDDPHAGSTFRVTGLGATGLPTTSFRG